MHPSNIFLACFTIFFIFGGSALVAISLQLKVDQILMYNTLAFGNMTYIANQGLGKCLYQYKYIVDTSIYTGLWVMLCDALNTRVVNVTFILHEPSCSTLIDLEGTQFNASSLCGSILRSVWFWPLLYSIGVVMIVAGSIQAVSSIRFLSVWAFPTVSLFDRFIQWRELLATVARPNPRKPAEDLDLPQIPL